MAEEGTATQARELDLSKYASIVISLVALVLSFWSLYFSHLRASSFSVHTSETFIARDYDSHTVLHVPMTFANSGAKMGVINNVQLAVQRRPGGARLIFENIGFDSVDANEELRRALPPGPIAVEGRAAASKNIRFSSVRKHANERVFADVGTYDVTVLVWDPTGDKPQATESFAVEITDQHLAVFEIQRASQRRDPSASVNGAWIDRARPRK
jgi:hypothetical protein